MTKHKKAVKLLAGILILLAAGSVWQFNLASKEMNQYEMAGRSIDTGSYQLHYYEEGRGDHTFVMITGSGTPCAYSDFYDLQKHLLQYGQTISFDHSGSGWSTRADTERSLENLVNELAALIDAVAENKKVILLCHSLGSLETIGYAQRYPERVEMIIFLDSGSPEFYSTDSETKAVWLNRSLAFLRVTGTNRFLGECGLFLPSYGEYSRHHKLNDEVKAMDKMMYYHYSGNPASLDTIRCMNENAGKVLAGPKLGDLPILVLSSDSGKSWDKVQLQLAGWSSDQCQITIRNSGHYLYWTDEKEVFSCIDKFMKYDAE